MIVTQQAAVHLGNDYLESVHSTKNQPQRTVKQLFDVTRKLVRDQKNPRYIRDRLEIKFLEKDDFVD